ncbi:DUF6483 family protein [Finegoldia magna]|uniref:Uncharacterized protein n=3 Tax=Finegoldia magna TaxID=1260 RepID=B0S2S2_FINM2|nr:DUF6483 family protein [Finegoldia magna]EFK94476.1 hypothetical protein HMPREF9261_1143 [Finegoldia magna ACS-171-V-Col3]EFL54510.1 hypothetical protein HMPREF9289_0376 [Finegoldia magna BVS033A4]EXF26406.1 hypothetical protein BA93_08550 [Finegoldia magna ALB8]KXA09842.1 hypothetical protein HMPREF3217_00636 [Finegoldia magna]MBS6927519.1 hypothetical protein [Finegoldia magna]
MIESNDWLLKQINVVSEFLQKLFTDMETSRKLNENEQYQKDSFEFERLLENLIEEDRINDAENILFEKLETNNLMYATIATRFYDKLKGLSDEKLQKSNYSRDEILQGLNDMCDMFGLEIFKG